MKYLAITGRAIFSLSFIGFGINHFRKTEKIAAYVPQYFPGDTIWVYITGILFLILGLLILLNYKAKIAGITLALVVAILTALIYLPDMMNNKMALAVYAAFIGSALFIAAKSE